MAKKLNAVVKLQLPAGKATPGPPVGSSLGPHGINIAGFVKEFNERTKDQVGLIIPAVLNIYSSQGICNPSGGSYQATVCRQRRTSGAAHIILWDSQSQRLPKG